MTLSTLIFSELVGWAIWALSLALSLIWAYGIRRRLKLGIGFMPQTATYGLLCSIATVAAYAGHFEKLHLLWIVPLAFPFSLVVFHIFGLGYLVAIGTTLYIALLKIFVPTLARKQLPSRADFYSDLSKRVTSQRRAHFENDEKVSSSISGADYSGVVPLIDSISRDVAKKIEALDGLAGRMSDNQDGLQMLFGFYLLITHLSLFEEAPEDEIKPLKKAFFQAVSSSDPDYQLHLKYFQMTLDWANENQLRADINGMLARVTEDTPLQDAILSTPAYQLTYGVGVESKELEFCVANLLAEPMISGRLYAALSELIFTAPPRAKGEN